MWVINAHGLVEGHTPDNLLAYDNKPQFCRSFTKGEYELLYQMLEMRDDHLCIHPHIAGVLHRNEFIPEKTFEAIRVLPNNTTRIGYSYVKKTQALIQQVADEDLPLFIGIEIDNVLKIILEWRLKCQRK